MNVTFRRAVAEDAPECGRICYEAFRTLADRHSFARDFRSAEGAVGLFGMLMGHPGFYGVVAEADGRIVGSNFMDERSAIRGIGPISVDPTVQNKGTGRLLMENVLNRASDRHAAGVRLVQAAYHNRSLCLYTTLGFQAREMLSVMQGPPLNRTFPGYTVRTAHPADTHACDALCKDIHGFDRGSELKNAIEQKTAVVVEYLGQITGYATLIGFFGHTVARSNQDLMALIGAAREFPGPGFLLPTRNYPVFSWCLANGLKLVMQTTLMSIGLYNEPVGAYLPNILY